MKKWPGAGQGKEPREPGKAGQPWASRRPSLTRKADRLLTPARSQLEPLQPLTPSPQRLQWGESQVSLRLQSQRSPPAACVHLPFEDTKFRFSTGQDSVTGLDQTLAWIRPFGARPWKLLLAQGPEAGGQRGTSGRAGSSMDTPGPSSLRFVLVFPALVGTSSSHSPALALVGRASSPPVHGPTCLASLRLL